MSDATPDIPTQVPKSQQVKNAVTNGAVAVKKMTQEATEQLLEKIKASSVVTKVFCGILLFILVVIFYTVNLASDDCSRTEDERRRNRNYRNFMLVIFVTVVFIMIGLALQYNEGLTKYVKGQVSP